MAVPAKALQTFTQVALIETNDGLPQAVMPLLGGDVTVGNISDYFYANGGSKRFAEATSGNSAYAEHFGPESQLIQIHVNDLATLAQNYEDVVIIGPGPAHSLRSKEMLVLQAILSDPASAIRRLHAVELSKEFARETAAVFAQDLAGMSGRERLEDVVVHEANFRLISGIQSPAFVICTGSLLNLNAANLTAFPARQMEVHLSDFARVAGKDGMVCLGYDASQDGDTLIRAYKTPQVAEFLLHPLERLGLQDHFEYEPAYSDSARMMIHYWVANKNLRLQYNGNTTNVLQGGKFAAMVSVKPDPGSLSSLAGSVGMQSEDLYRAPANDYCLQAFRCG